MLQPILEKNNAGVLHLLHGRHKKAKTAFKSALVHLGILIQKHQSSESLGSASSLFPFAVQATSSIPESTNPHSPSHTFYMFRHALIVTATSSEAVIDEITWMDDTHIGFWTAVLTYNLSLAYHIQRDYECDKSEANCDKILKFYQKTLIAVQQISNQRQPRSLLSEYRTTITMSVFMNMGAILFDDEGKLEKAKHCLDMMLKKKQPEQEAFLETYHLRDRLLTNLFLLQERLAEKQRLETIKEQQRKVQLKAWEDEYYQHFKQQQQQKKTDSICPNNRNLIVPRTA